MQKPKINGGFYIKARSIENSSIAHAQPATREIFDFLVRACNHDTGKSSGRVIKRGQCMISQDQIREALHWKSGFRKEYYSLDQIKRSLAWLEDEGMVIREKTTRGTIITLPNYDTYQSISNYLGSNTLDKFIDENTYEELGDYAGHGTGAPMGAPMDAPMGAPTDAPRPVVENAGQVRVSYDGNFMDAPMDAPTDAPMDAPMGAICPPDYKQGIKRIRKKEEVFLAAPKSKYSSTFFDDEIMANIASPEINGYVTLVDFLHGYVGEIGKMTNVLKIKKQLTYSQYTMLKELESRPGQLKTLIENLENYEKKGAKYTSVYLTLRNWMRNEKNK